MELIQQIFYITMGMLYGIAMLFGTTYKVVNIICYFYFVPAGFIYIVSKKNHKAINLIPLGFLIYFMYLPNFNQICNTLFDDCVIFLNKSAELFNSNYIDMSVYICVIIPVIVLMLSSIMVFSKKFNIRLLSTLSILIGIYYFVGFPIIQKLLKPFLEFA